MCGAARGVPGKAEPALRYDLPEIRDVIVKGDDAVVRLTRTPTVTVGNESETTEEEGMDVFRRQPDGRRSIARYVAFTTAPNRLLE